MTADNRPNLNLRKLEKATKQNDADRFATDYIAAKRYLDVF